MAVRMKLEDDFDEKELDVEYEGAQFERYTGEVPKSGTILIARVTKAWFTTSSDGDYQIKLIAVAEQNKGKLAEFNGLPTWENLTFIKSASRRYQAFLYNFGLTVRDVKRKLMVASEDDNIGTPIESIAGWEVGSDDALCRIVIKRDWYNEEWQSKFDWDGWLPFDEADEDQQEEPEDEEDTPARTTRRAPATRSRSRRAEPEPEPEPEDEEEPDDEEYDDDEEEEAAPPPRRTRQPVRATRASATRSRPAARSNSRSGGKSKTARSSTKQDDPPF